MSDTNLQAVIYTCPPQHAAAVLGALDDAGLGQTWGEPLDADALVLCHTYAASGGAPGEDLAEALAALDGVAFRVWDDPDYEFLGTLHMHTPELGRFSVECNSDGYALLSSIVLDGLTERTSTAEALVAAIRQHLGTAWEEALMEAATREVRVAVTDQSEVVAEPTKTITVPQAGMPPVIVTGEDTGPDAWADYLGQMIGYNATLTLTGQAPRRVSLGPVTQHPNFMTLTIIPLNEEWERPAGASPQSIDVELVESIYVH
jgi:hypothetical protein